MMYIAISEDGFIIGKNLKQILAIYVDTISSLSRIDVDDLSILMYIYSEAIGKGLLKDIPETPDEDTYKSLIQGQGYEIFPYEDDNDMLDYLKSVMISNYPTIIDKVQKMSFKDLDKILPKNQFVIFEMFVPEEK